MNSQVNRTGFRVTHPHRPEADSSVSALIRVSYLDQNKAFAAAIPRSGLFGREVRRLSLQELGENWSLLRLTAPFEYNDRSYHRLLIKSRWKGHEVGISPRTSVFILLCSDSVPLARNELESADCDLVAWGMAEAMAVPRLYALAQT